MRILILCTFFCFRCISINAQVKLSIRLKSDSSLERAEKIFLAGNVNNWNPADSMYQLVYHNGFYEGLFANFPSGKLEFKFTKGSWSSVEKDKQGADIPNREVVINTDTTLNLALGSWSENKSASIVEHTATAQVSILDSAFFIPQLNSYRRIWIYLPPDYTESKRKYPVIYAQDGQNLFDKSTAYSNEWQLDETLDSIYDAKGITCIVIGIDNDSNRMRDYNPFDNEKFGPGLGENYISFIAETLKPYVDAHYRTLKDPANTVILGSSMGGLISFYAAVSRPDVFGKAGIFSPAFWIAPQIDSLTLSLAARSNGQYFFYAGEKESEEMVRDMYRISDKLSANSKALAYTITDADGQHNEVAWRKWFPEFVKWIFSNGYEYQLSVN